MKFKFTIARKLSLGFGLLGIVFVVNSIMIFRTLQGSININKEIKEIYTPSIKYLGDLYEMINNSNLLIKNWVYIDQTERTPDKLKLMKLHDVDYPEIDFKLDKISGKWNEDNRQEYERISNFIKDTLFPKHKFVMLMLNDVDSYKDPMTMFDVEDAVNYQITPQTEKALEDLSNLSSSLEEIAAEKTAGMTKTFDNFSNIIFWMTFLLIVALIIIAYVTTSALVRPIVSMRDVLSKMSLGILPNKDIKISNDEIGQMADTLNQLVGSLKQITDFANNIGVGNFNKEFQPLSEDDTLGNSLVHMRDNLKKAAEDEERRKDEDAQRSWASNGIAKFSDILRANNHDIEKLSNDVISNLVKYLNINVGGFFIKRKDKDKADYLELMGCYAYDREKQLEKTIKVNEGLIGRSIREMEPIYLTDIPDDYMNISSGMGDEKPYAILIVPIMVNDEVYGVFELASFREIEKYKIDFLKRLGESVASAIASVEGTLNTKKLLETTQMQADEMASQEEEMRQNMEELQATQEESERREQELLREIDDLKAEIRRLRKSG